MSCLRIILLATSLMLLAVIGGGAEEPVKNGAQKDGKLIGTWKAVSARYNGQEYKFPEGTTTLKHVTPSQFMWATYDKDGKVFRCAGGEYQLNNDDYQETIAYGIGDDFDVIKKQTHSFKCKLAGNQWRHDGKLANGTTIEEIWERVERK